MSSPTSTGPTAASGPPSISYYRPSGDTAPRFSPTVLVLLFAGAVAVAVVVALALVILLRPRSPSPFCAPGEPCGGPPPGAHLANSASWQSSELGYHFEYPAQLLKVVEEDGRSVRLRLRSATVDVEIWVSAAPLNERSPETMLEQRLGSLEQGILGLTDDSDRHTMIFGPSIGYIDGVGGSYRGTADSPQGPGAPVAAAVVAASDGHLSAVVSVVHVNASTDEDGVGLEKYFRGVADNVLKTFAWKQAG